VRKVKYPNGDFYHGQLLDGKKHGKGKITYNEKNAKKQKEL
jgi:hypothetical protein